MTDKQKAKQAKKGESAATSADSPQVKVSFTLNFTATISPTPSPPCYVSDHRFTFSLFSSTPTTSPPVGQWSPCDPPAPAPAPSTDTPPSPTPLPPPPSLTWSTSADVTVDRDLLLSFERGLLPLHLEQRRLLLSADPDPVPVPLSSPKAASKAKPPPVASKKRLPGADDGRPSLAHPALDDLPFAPYATLHLPLSALLCPPHSVAFTAPSLSSFTLPPGLASLTCHLDTGGVSPIAPALLSSLLPVSVHLHSLTQLTPPTVLPSSYRDLALSLSLPDCPPIPPAWSYPPSTGLSFTPSTLPPRVVFLGLLPPSLLWSLACDSHSGLLLSIRDRDDARIPTPSELQAAADAQHRADTEAREAEETRVREEAKKAGKKPLKSPKGGKKADAPLPPPDATPVPPPPAADPPPPFPYDGRSNVYGVATLPLHGLFQAPHWQSGVTGVEAVYPPAGVALLPPAVRANGYRDTGVGYTVRAMTAMPAVEGLRDGLRYGRVVAVMDDCGETAAWSEVYEEVLRCNAKACGVDPLPASWDWLEGVVSPGEEETTAAVEAEKAVEPMKEAVAKPAKKAAKGEDKAGKDSAPAVPTADAAALAASPKPGADHLTGVFVTDGRQRLLIVEGLAVSRPGAAALAAVQAKLAAMKRRVGRMRLLVDDALAFPARLYAGTPLSLLHLRLSAPLSSLVTKASSLSSSPASFLALSKLSALGKGAVVRTLLQAWEGRVMLEAGEVQQLKAAHGRKERLDEVYGPALAQREREARRARKAQEAAGQPSDAAIDAAPVTAPTDAPVSADPCITTTAAATDPASSPAAGDASTDTVVAPALQETVAVGETQTQTVGPHPQSAPSSLARLPPLTYSSPAEYRACLQALREACHADRAHHYTFHLAYLHSSIPRWEDAEEAERDARRRARALWLNPRGFITAGHPHPPRLFGDVGLLSAGERRREREERRRVRGVEEKVEEGWRERVQRGERRREVGFLTQPSFPALFDRGPQASVHLTGEEEVRERREREEKEREDWRAKLCVDDPAFRVLWRGQHTIDHRGDVGGQGGRTGGKLGGGTGRLFGLEGLRKDPPMKAALKFEREGAGAAGRSLVVEPAPVSIAIEGKWGGGLVGGDVQGGGEAAGPGGVRQVRHAARAGVQEEGEAGEVLRSGQTEV